jgi:hypothetical protein
VAGVPSAKAVRLVDSGGSASADVPQNVYEPSSPMNVLSSAAVICASGGTAGSPAPFVGHGAAAVPPGVGKVKGGIVGLGVAAGLAVGDAVAVGVGGPQQSFGGVGDGVAGVPNVQAVAAKATVRPAAKTSGAFIGYLPE